MESTLNLQSYTFSKARTYLAASLFIIGNLILPQICHMLPLGGSMWLPIYFFTLIGAYKYGWRVGLITAILSPAINSAIFGMPAPAVLPAILIKSILLATATGYAAYRFGKATLTVLLGIVMFYQLIGTGAEWIISGNFLTAVQDFRIGLPGMVFQIAGGWVILNKVLNR